MTDTTRTAEARKRERLIRELEAQHSAFDRTLAEELRRPAPDVILIRRLKRAKLALKDRAAMIANTTRDTFPSPARG